MRGVVLVLAFLVSACGSGPSGPSSVSPDSLPPAPVPEAVRVGTWNVTVSLTAVNGDGCVADAMRAQIGVPEQYSVTITRRGQSVYVTLTSASGDYACTFTNAWADENGFTTYGRPGYFRCENHLRPFRCGDGTPHDLFSFGQDISGRFAGNKIDGTWDAVWGEMEKTGEEDVEATAQFTGSRR